MKLIITILAFLLCSNAFASGSTTKQIDIIQNSSGGSQISVPGVGSAMITDSATQTLTNKTVSGSSNTITNISTGSLASGFTLGAANGGTGLTSITAHDLIIGNGTSAATLVAPGSQYSVLQSGGGSADPAYGAVHLDQSAAVTGILGHANGGSDASSLASGAANFLGSLTNSTSSGFFLEYNGTNYVFSAIPSVAPSLNGGSATPQSVTAVGGISLSSIMYGNEAWVSGSGGAVTVTAVPSVTACTADGQQLKVHGTSDTDTVTLQDHSSLSGSGLYLNGPVTLGAQQSIAFHCDVTLSAWVEDSRSN